MKRLKYCAFKDKGLLGRFKAFTKPVWIVTPINILEVLTKPLSLCMRLFGNIIAAFTIMELVKAVPFMKFGFPAVFSLYFDLFDGLLQAYIFVFLTSIYLQEAVEEEEEEPKETKKMRKAQKKAEKLAKKQAKKTKAALFCVESAQVSVSVSQRVKQLRHRLVSLKLQVKSRPPLFWAQHSARQPLFTVLSVLF